MSTYQNTHLLERAAELIDELASHPAGYDKMLITAVESNNLDEVYRLVVKIEGDMAQEMFHNWDITVW